MSEERQTLLDLKSALLLPLKAKNAMPGVVALVPRLGDLPLSGEDKRLLQSVGASASLALENAQLIKRMIAEARRPTYSSKSPEINDAVIGLFIDDSNSKLDHL